MTTQDPHINKIIKEARKVRDAWENAVGMGYVDQAILDLSEALDNYDKVRGN